MNPATQPPPADASNARSGHPPLPLSIGSIPQLAALSGLIFGLAYVAGRVYADGYYSTFHLDASVLDLSIAETAFLPLKDTGLWITTLVMGIAYHIAVPRQPKRAVAIKDDFAQAFIELLSWRTSAVTLVVFIGLVSADAATMLDGSGWNWSLFLDALAKNFIVIFAVIWILTTIRAVSISYQTTRSYLLYIASLALIVTTFWGLVLGICTASLVQDQDDPGTQWQLTFRTPTGEEKTMDKVVLIGHNDRFLALWDVSTRRAILQPTDTVVRLQSRR